MSRSVHSLYFSPTRGTAKVIDTISREIISALPGAKKGLDVNLTVPAKRKPLEPFGKDDLLVLGFPVYAGRIPQILLPFLDSIQGNETPAVIAAVYGNRHFEDSLLEAAGLLTEKGFNVTAAGAFIGEHSYSKLVAAGRPDAQDLAMAKELGAKTAAKLQKGGSGAVQVPGNKPYRAGTAAVPRAPKTSDACTGCLLCAENCPSGAISRDDPKLADAGTCISCCACVKGCPVGAKYFDDEAMAQRKALSESKFMERREPQLFV